MVCSRIQGFLFGLGAAVAIAAFAPSADAQSPGCAAVNATAILAPTSSVGPLVFEAGEVIVASVGLPSMPPVTVDASFGGATVTFLNTVVAGTGSFTVPASGSGQITNSSSIDSVDVVCQAVSTNPQAAANATAQGAITQSAGLVAGRIRTVTRGGGNPGGAGGSGGPSGLPQSSGLLDLSLGRTGMAAGDADPKWGVWANFSWTGIEDRTPVAGQDGDVAIGMVGADYAVSEGFLVGGAVSIGGATFDSAIAAFDTGEVNIGLNPYLAYRLSDVFSLDAVAGYSFGVGDSERAETITGHYSIHRYYVATNATYFQSWDRVSLLASTGVLWGQSFEAAYTESDGTRVSSRQTDLGSAKLLLQPSYVFDLDPDTGVFLEPYLLGEYSYDFVITKIAGHNNDRDAFRIGAGVNLFSGPALSANFEASTVLGREEQGAISVLGTLRYAF